MLNRLKLSIQLLDAGFKTLTDNLKDLTLEEALYIPSGGFRSIIGTLKHTAAWSHIYRSYAFDALPASWNSLAWPGGLRDTILQSDAYLASLLTWLVQSHQLWQRDLLNTMEDEFEQPRPVHWGDSLPLFDIVCLMANHHVYHAGEINQILSICRHEAWEEGEEVEENHIPTAGHRVVPPWKQ